MSRIDLASILLQMMRSNLSKAEKTLLEVKLFNLIYSELGEIFKQKYRDFNQLVPSLHKENAMLNINFFQEIINDILATQEYTLMGIAYHTHIPIEVLFDIVSGLNANPAFESSRRLFELHIIVRRDLYQKMIKKLLLRYLSKDLLTEENEKELVHMIKNNRPACAVLNEEDYITLPQQKSSTASLWELLDHTPSKQNRKKQAIKKQIQDERDHWEK